MIIWEKIREIKVADEIHWEHYVVVLFIILFVILAFGLGRLSEMREERTPIKIEYAQNRIFPHDRMRAADTKAQAIQNESSNEKKYVASKNGTRYYLPSCGGVSNIKDENKVWFRSTEEALFNGYTRAQNCF